MFDRTRQFLHSFVLGRGIRIDELSDPSSASSFQNLNRSGHINLAGFERMRQTIRQTILCRKMKDGVNALKETLNRGVTDINAMELHARRNILARPLE